MMWFGGISLHGQADQYEKKGFNPEHSYQVGDVDAVNVFNGALTINLPLGQRYPVGGSLSYGLNLIHTGPKFVVREENYICSPGPCADPVDYFAEPDPWFNAGFGWMVNPGMFIEANALPVEYAARMPSLNKFRSRYVAPDGSEHYFYGSIHEGESGTGENYSRDNTYLRLKTVSASLKTIEFPNGDIHEFQEIHPDWGTWRVTKIRDRFGNEINFTYTNATWTISDPFRTHFIHFQFVPELEDLTVTGGWIVDSVEVASFGGQTSTWDLQYTALDPEIGSGLEEGCFGHDQDEDPSRSPAFYYMEMLTKLVLPDGSSYRMGEAGEAWYDPRCTGFDEPGVIEAMKLPTEGNVEWHYGFRDMPVNNEDTRQNQFPDPVVTPTNGVDRRTLKDAADQVIATWEYSAEVWPSPQPDNKTDVREVRVHVKDPAGDCVTHYFDADPGWTSQGPDSGWAYGLPFAQSQPSGGRFLSAVVTDSADPTTGKCNGTTLRETYVRYDHDELPAKPGQIEPWWLANLHNSNRRLIEERTVFVDDGSRYAGTVYSDFDGLGHYRTATTNGNFDAGNVRTTTTNYNAGNGTYPGSFVPPGATAPWVLNTYDETSISEGGTTYKQQFCFNPATGFLDRKRILAGSTQQANDVIVHYNMDPRFSVPGGMVQFERYFGGDLQEVSTGSNLCSIGVPTEEQYEIEHEAEDGHGTVRWSRYNVASGNGIGFKFLDQVIDPNTGLASVTRGVDLLETAWTYDGLGRPTLADPDANHKGAQTQYIFTPASGTNIPARVDILEKTNDGSSILTERRLRFDGQGRLMREERRLPGGAFNRRDTEYTPRGFLESVSTTWTGTPSSETTYAGYDQFGRPGSITSPDGSVVSFDYDGVRRVKRTVSVGGSAATTTEEYDRQGRLIKITEPTGTVTSYEYDPADRLVQVQITGGNITQTRTFEYDGRGFLLSESHPEKSGQVTYSNRDARGNARTKIDGGVELTIQHDRAERIEKIIRASDGQDLKTFDYATDTVGTNHRRGKLHKAWRFHDHSALSGVPDVVIEEEYEYRGPGGLASLRAVRKNGAGLFNVETGHNALGLPTLVCYPLRCGDPNTDIVSYSYTEGLLTAVPGYAGSISYHPNLMLASIAHSNNVTDVWTADLNRIRRPGRIHTTGVTTGQPFDSGTFSYDGAGNITAMGVDTFQYDSISRLTSGTAAQSQYTETNTFDPFGNRVAATTLGLSRQNPTNPATNRLLGTTYRPITYDAAGNLTSWGTADYTYDPLNTMTRLQDGGVDQSYLYTADDERVAVLHTSGGSQASARWMIRDLNNQVVRTYTQDGFNDPLEWEKDYIRRGTQLLAREHVTGGTHHAHLDHLGTPRLWTHPDGSMLARHDYLPFGEEVTTTMHDEEVQFTGHERDPHPSGGCSGTTQVDNQTLSNGEDFLGCDALSSSNTTVAGTQEVRFTSGVEIALGPGFTVNAGADFVAEIDGSVKLDEQDLDYMHARYASPWLGRFGSVDPVLRLRRALLDPQEWNRYSYAANNPIGFIDPTGEIFIAVGRTEDEAQRVLELVRKALEEANAATEAALLQLERINGEYRITSGDADLSTSENSTVALIGATISTEQRVAVGLTNRSLAKYGGAVGAYDPDGTYSIGINLDTLASTIVPGQRADGALVGLTVSGGTALVHELGHPAGSFLDGAPPYPAGLTNAHALRYENEHRKLRARGRTPSVRTSHDRLYPPPGWRWRWIP